MLNSFFYKFNIISNYDEDVLMMMYNGVAIVPKSELTK